MAFDRLLARLLAADPDGWVLKGGFALQLRLGRGARTTKDLDLGRADDERAATGHLIAAQRVDLGDFFAFAIERTGALEMLEEGAAMRYRARAELAGRLYEEVVVDVGFDGPVPVEAEQVDGPDLLGFAGIPRLRVPVLRVERQVAEKLHAYTRPYAGGRDSTRVKDLVDLVLFRAHSAPEAGRLRLAIRETFETRGAHPVPVRLPPPPGSWDVPFRRLAVGVGLDADVKTGYALAASFLDGVLSSDVADEAEWDPKLATWRAPGTAT